VLRTIEDLEGYTIGATDGTIGHVKDFYFDDAAWIIRYLVVETGNWLSHRRVLISPSAINQPDWSEKIFPAAITQQQVKNSPSIDTDKPVSRQHEIGYLDYYKYPYYWEGGDFWGDGMMWLGIGRSTAAEKLRPDAAANPEDSRHADPHLRSRNEIAGYDVLAVDCHIGHVQGFLLDENGWAIRFIVVNTSNWWLGHQVLVAPQWITDMRWKERTVSVGLSSDAVRASPPYSPGAPMGRDEEARIYHHYDRPGYWAREVKMQNPELRVINGA
jgi:uncharacterized protein YrrD